MKKWLEPLTIAWSGLVTHKLRSLLTILGIVIGVAAVIVLMSIGKGAEASIISRIESLGSDLIYVRPGAVTVGGVRSAPGSATTLTLEDANAISEEVPNIAAVAPAYSTMLQIVASSQNMRSQVSGITPEYQQVFNLQTTDGSFITEYQYQSGMRVAVIGPDVKETLFGDSSPVGQQMRVGTLTVRVIGVLQSKGESALGSTDSAILIPLTALQQTLARSRTTRGEHAVTLIVLKVGDENQSSQTVDEITSLLRYRHQLAADASNDFNITSMQELVSTISETMGILTILLGAIAAISLVVGGIGVMNIMLVSVVERTREIGIRKALGAKERDIWGQFLVEAASLTLVGGIIGVAAGWALSSFVTGMGWVATVVSADIVILAVSVSVGIGLFFGFYPAWNASRLNPIEALRSE